MIATEKPASSSLFSAQFGSSLLLSPRGLIRCAVIAWEFWGFSSCVNCHLFLILLQLLCSHLVINWASIINLRRTQVIFSEYLFTLQQPRSQSLLLIKSNTGVFWERFWKGKSITHWSSHLLGFLGGVSLWDFTKERWKETFTMICSTFDKLCSATGPLVAPAYIMPKEACLTFLLINISCDLARKMFPLWFCELCLRWITWNITLCEYTFFLWCIGGFWRFFFLDWCVSTRHIFYFYFNFGNFKIAMEMHQGSLCFLSRCLVLTVPATLDYIDGF